MGDSTNDFLSLPVTSRNLLEFEMFPPGRRRPLGPPEDGSPPSVPTPDWLSLSLLTDVSLISPQGLSKVDTAQLPQTTFPIASLASLSRAFPNT